MKSKYLIIKDLEDIDLISTSHGIGLKKVLLDINESESNITQIAITSLAAGEITDVHNHISMEEHFIFLKGEGSITVDGISYACKKGTYIRISKGVNHSLRAISDIKIISIGLKN